MRNAGLAAASVISRRFRESLNAGVEIHTGPGNNGGDGWVIAGELAKQGIPVRVVEALPPKTPDAIEARAAATTGSFNEIATRPGLLIDALLGTGSSGAPKGVIAEAVESINRARQNGTEVVALDLPTGLDATSGSATNCVRASLTLSFATVKRGQLIARDVCGEIQVLDIGLGEFGVAANTELALADAGWVARRIPAIQADAHKGSRKRLAVIAGDEGMAGAAILAGKAALRSGIGLLHLIVARENRGAVHVAIPSALVSTHEELFADPAAVLASADAIVMGPGLKPERAMVMLELLADEGVPIVLDAGSLTGSSGDTRRIQALARTREIILTPHPAELGRLVGQTTREVLENRFEIGSDLARQLRVTVLLKGTPTIVSSSNGQRMVSATGTPALATGGSGDLLSGIIGTLVAQSGRGFESAVCGAWVHGRAAELCGTSRGVTLDDILFAMPAAWRTDSETPRYPVLTRLSEIQ